MTDDEFMSKIASMDDDEEVCSECHEVLGDGLPLRIEVGTTVIAVFCDRHHMYSWVGRQR